MARPAHLQAFRQIERRVSAPTRIQQPPTGWSVVDDDDSWGNDDDDNRPNTRAQKARREAERNPPMVNNLQPQPQPRQQPPLPVIQEEEERESETEDPLGFGLYDSDSPTTTPQPRPQPPQAPDTTGEDRRNRHKCPACRTLFKLWNGIRTCPCGHDGLNKQLVTDQVNKHLWVEDLDTNERMGEVAYARGLVDHPDYFTVPALAATVHAARNCGVLLSPSITSSSEDEQTADYDDSDSAPVHGFSPESSEDEPVTGYRRNSSTRYDTLDDTVPAAPQQIQAGTPPTAPATPPNPTATPPRSPLPYQLRSGRTHKGAPKKKRGGTRGRT